MAPIASSTLAPALLKVTTTMDESRINSVLASFAKTSTRDLGFKDIKDDDFKYMSIESLLTTAYLLRRIRYANRAYNHTSRRRRNQ